ncbi:hypothetical protein BCR32DRAFT_307342 [Anaeromyces robustus]|uniref:Uncharacterized protein n=1 Tax=Anaeromyces robustus TaxID=1754192 RepID=A0A1Y1VR39_9FUNG|nr:hypothetical protein BCR32DRAFT_307342 [Anaeromyces robustus]|eukprot:ORX63737.1 hypothetical protein BCR32DRAFT_307342 [Anaeromyces robustus]
MENQSKSITFNRLPILGSSKTTFDEWKFSFDHWCKTFNITEESEKIDYLLAITDKIARTIVYNSLNKSTPDDYDTILTNLGKHFKKTTSKNSRILELSSITIRKDESISDFDLRFSDLLNQVNKTVTMSDVIVTSYYINAYRNWPKIYENLMEEEPITLEGAMKITSKKEKIMNLIKENKEKGTSSKEKLSNSNSTRKHTDNHYNNYSYKNVTNFKQPSKSNYEKYNSNNNNYNNQNKSFFNNNYYEQNKNNHYNKEKLTNETNNNPKGKLNDNDIDEITKKLAGLNLNFCVNCLRIGHNYEECNEKEIDENNDDHLN